MATPLGVEIFSVLAGPLRLLEPSPAPLDYDAAKAAAGPFEREVAGEIRALLAQSEDRPQGDEPPEHDYAAMLEAVAKVPPLERRTAVTAGLPDVHLGVEYLAQFDRVYSFLQDAFPRRVVGTLTGDQQVEPSQVELSQFWRVLESIEDPRVLLRDMRQGELCSDQVEMVETLYPNLYAFLCEQILSALAEKKAADNDWEPAHDVRRQLETILQVSPLDPNLAAQLQARARAADQAHEAAKGGKDSGGAGAPDLHDSTAQLQTPTQRISAR